MAVIYGTAGADRKEGTPADDKGDDTLIGYYGDDMLYGWDRNDSRGRCKFSYLKQVTSITDKGMP